MTDRQQFGALRLALGQRPMSKERGWRDQHILVVNASDERLDFIEREIVRRIGDRLYGGRRND